MTRPPLRSVAKRAALLNRISRLWLEGQTQAAIARQLDTVPSAIAGIVARARQRGDDRFVRRSPGARPRESKPKMRRVKPAEMAVGNRRPAAPVAVVRELDTPARRDGGLLLIDLRPAQCRFPVNDPRP